jgi:hypothetical protein
MTRTNRRFVVAYAGNDDQQQMTIIECNGSVLQALAAGLQKLDLGPRHYHPHTERDREDSRGRRFSVWRAELEGGQVWIYEQIAGPQLTDLRDWEF